MSLNIVIPGRVPRGRCRICNHLWFDTDTDESIGRHNRECAQAHYERTQPDRDRLAFLQPQDPEYADWIKTAYAQGRVKPSTKPV